jgi:hypothetical protein
MLMLQLMLMFFELIHIFCGTKFGVILFTKGTFSPFDVISQNQADIERT